MSGVLRVRSYGALGVDRRGCADDDRICREAAFDEDIGNSVEAVFALHDKAAIVIFYEIAEPEFSAFMQIVKFLDLRVAELCPSGIHPLKHHHDVAGGGVCESCIAITKKPVERSFQAVCGIDPRRWREAPLGGKHDNWNAHNLLL